MNFYILSKLTRFNNNITEKNYNTYNFKPLYNKLGVLTLCLNVLVYTMIINLSVIKRFSMSIAIQLEITITW